MRLSRAFAAQARACAGLGSPFMAQLLRLLAGQWPVHTRLGRICAEWPGDLGPGGASVPLRIAGGLHALVLSRRDAALARVYPPNTAIDATLIAAVIAAMRRHEDLLIDWIQSPPQTNEVCRSAVLIAAANWLVARHPLPIIASELGASAGLNLMWDRYALRAGKTVLGPAAPALTIAPEWSGPVPAAARVIVAQRRGVDLNPVDCHSDDGALRLFAYLWPDQPQRMDLTRAAIAAQDATVDRGDAIDWLAPRLSSPDRDHLHLIYHTVAWQYFPEERQRRGAALIEAAGARADETAPLAWLRMEADGAADGAAVTLRLWPGDRYVTLARADFHGRWLCWEAE